MYFQKKNNHNSFLQKKHNDGNVFFQTKLSINQPNDFYEQEADEVSEKVMRMSMSKIENTFFKPANISSIKSNTNVNRKCTECEEEELQRKEDNNGELEANKELESFVGGLSSGGDALPNDTRNFFEPRFGYDFSNVKVHTNSEANKSAQSINALAYTSGKNIVFNKNQYSPETESGKKLLGHELTHVVQQGNWLNNNINKIQLSRESDMIDYYTSLLGNLDEAGLGSQLVQHAIRGDYDFVQRVLDELGSTDRDDVSYEFMHAASDNIIQSFVRNESGRSMLDRLFDELTSGNISNDEQAQADRIISNKTQILTSPVQFDQAVNSRSLKFFPFRLPGITVYDDASISAERREHGRIWIKLPVRVLGTSMFAEQTRTLPSEVFTSGIEIPETEIIGVKMYDLGGIPVFKPALFLIQLSNVTDITILQNIVEVAGIALTFGSGSLAATATSRLGQLAIFADRVAFGVGVITTIIREHRGWIIERFGDPGQEFLRYIDIVNSVVALYGGARALIGMGQLLGGFYRSINNWRQALPRVNPQLSQSEQEVVRQITRHAEDTLQDIEQIQVPAAGSAPEAAAATPSRGFDPEGRLPRRTERVVLNQGNAPTCGPVSCGMVIDTMGNRYELAQLVLEAGPMGTPLDRMLSIIRRHNINADMRLNLTVDLLAEATRNGNPAIAVIRTNTPGQALHAIVIDGITTRLGQRVVAIRNPWGLQYFELVEVFERSFIGQGITINFSF